MKFASSIWVFPGGVWEAADGDVSSPQAKAAAMRVTALRESFEETGVVPVSGGGAAAPPSQSSWRNWRDRVRGDATAWPAFIREVLVPANVDLLPAEPFCCFLTPEIEKRRTGRQYETHFLLGVSGDTSLGNVAEVDAAET